MKHDSGMHYINTETGSEGAFIHKMTNIRIKVVKNTK